MPPLTRGHGYYCWLVVKALTDYLARRESGHLLTNDTGIVVGRGPDTVRGADVMAFLRAAKADDSSEKYVEDIPDLIVEVVSPSDTYGRLSRRLAQYVGRGVPLIWFVDPEARTVSAYRRNELPEVLDDSDELTGGSVLPGFRCRVADLFALPGPDGSQPDGG